MCISAARRPDGATISGPLCAAKAGILGLSKGHRARSQVAAYSFQLHCPIRFQPDAAPPILTEERKAIWRSLKPSR